MLWEDVFLNIETYKKPSLIFSKPSIEDLRFKELDKKRANAGFAAKSDFYYLLQIWKYNFL